MANANENSLAIAEKSLKDVDSQVAANAPSVAEHLPMQNSSALIPLTITEKPLKGADLGTTSVAATDSPSAEHLHVQSSSALSNSNTLLASISTSDLAISLNKHNSIVQNSRLLDLPKELTTRIYRYAIAVHTPICPVQVAPNANKFVWSPEQLSVCNPNLSFYSEHSKAPRNITPRLTVVALSQTCKQIYADVSLTHVFYTDNEFSFRDKHIKHAMAYLIGITRERRNHIQHLRLKWSVHDFHRGPHLLFNLIASMKGLRKLDMHVEGSECFVHLPLEKIKGVKEFLNALDGLIELNFHEDRTPHRITQGSFDDEIDELKVLSHARMDLGKERGTYDPILLRAAEEMASLHIHGEGRLNADKKPGMISSRTRGAIRAFSQVNGDGVVPERSSPRYDLDGDLAWHIFEVKDARENETGSIEFLIRAAPESSHRSEVTETWEDISVLNSDSARQNLYWFYETKQKADTCGLKEVLEVWKLREDRKEKKNRWLLRGLTQIRANALKRAAQEAKAALEKEKQAEKEVTKRKRLLPDYPTGLAYHSDEGRVVKQPRTSREAKPNKKAVLKTKPKTGTSRRPVGKNSKTVSVDAENDDDDDEDVVMDDDDADEDYGS